MVLIPIDQLQQKNQSVQSPQPNLIPVQDLLNRESSFTRAQFEPLGTEPSPTTFVQDLMLSLAPNDERRLEFLAKEFQGQRVDFDPVEGFKVNDVRVNPKGFDFGDLSRNAGFSFNIAGQIIGSIVGAKAGPAGIFVGGTIGNTLGEGIRLAVGDLVGFNPDEHEVFEALTQEAKLGAVGEAVGFGIIGGGVVGKSLLSKMSQTKVLKSVGGIFSKSINKIKGVSSKEETVQDVLRFVGNINEDATRIAVIKNKPSEVLNERFFDPRTMLKTVKRTLFGDTQEVRRLGELDIDVPGKSTMSKGNELILKSLKEDNNDGYVRLIQRFTGIDDTAIQSIKNIPEKELLSPENFSPELPATLASKFVKSVTERRKVLGDAIGKRIKKFAKDPSKPQFFLDDLGVQIRRLINSNDFISGIREPGFKPKKALNVPGVRQLKDLADLFQGVRTKPILDPITGREILPVTGKAEPFNFLSKRNAVKLNEQVDALVDTIRRNKNAPKVIKDTAKGIRSAFKDRFYSQLDLGDDIVKFRTFAELTDDIVTEGRAALPRFERMFSRMDSISRVERARVFDAISGLPTKIGNSITKRLSVMATARQFNKTTNAGKMFRQFEGILNKPGFLSTIVEGTDEAILRDLDRLMASSPNPLVSSRVFVDNAEKSVAAREFLKNTVNVLRISTIASLVGLGAFLGGPLGGLVGLFAARATSPRQIAKFLVKTEGMGGKIGRKLDRVKQKARINQRQRRIIRSLLGVTAGRQFAPRPSGVNSSNENPFLNAR